MQIMQVQVVSVIILYVVGAASVGTGVLLISVSRLEQCTECLNRPRRLSQWHTHYWGQTHMFVSV